MRTILPVTDSVIILTMLMVSPIAAQDVDLWNADSIRNCIVTRVRNAPFSAEAVTTWHPPAESGMPEMSSTRRYYRDRDGRVRVEFVGGVTPQRVIVTSDADTAGAYHLDTVERIVFSPRSRSGAAMFIGGGCSYRAYPNTSQFVLPLSMCRHVTYFTRGVEEGSLGERWIEGVQTMGTRFGPEVVLLPSPGTPGGENWVSPELQLLVYGRHEDPDAGVIDYRLSKITRTDPPTGLFEVPADYRPERLFPYKSMQWHGAARMKWAPALRNLLPPGGSSFDRQFCPTP